jgi:hypothetical protein
VALFVCLSLSAAPPAPEKPKAPEDEPHGLRLPSDFDLAAAIVAAPSEPRTAAWTAAGLLAAGSGQTLQYWSFGSPVPSFAWTIASAAGVLPASANPLGQLTFFTLLQAGHQNNLWTIIDDSVVRRLPHEQVLKQNPRGDIPRRQDLVEFEAYVWTLIQAARTSEKAFRAAAAANRGINYAVLYDAPADLIGEVIEVKGRLRRLRRIDAPTLVREQGNAPFLYEAWIFNEELYGPNPVVAVFTDLPPGLEPAEKTEDVPVTFVGYYYKLWEYKAARDVGARDVSVAPLLIGRTIEVGKRAPAGEDEHWGKGLLPLFLGFIAVVAGGVVALAVWFRRADVHVQRRLDASRAAPTFLEPDGPPPADARDNGTFFADLDDQEGERGASSS